MDDGLKLDIWEMIQEKRKSEIEEEELRKQELIKSIKYYATMSGIGAIIGLSIIIVVRFFI